MEWISKKEVNTKKYHVFAPMGRFQLELIYLYFPPTVENKGKLILKEIGVNTRNWIDSAQDRDYWRDLVNAALNLRIP